MHRYVTEFIGTFFLVATTGLSGDPLVIGSVLMAMVYMGGHVSGAHYNPAISFAIWLRGRFESSQFVPYVVSQLLGAFAAAAVVKLIGGGTFAPVPGADVSTTAALLSEVIFTFALALVILNVATSRKTEGNSYYGLAIGFTVMAGASAVGGISGGVFNPAAGTGPTLMHSLAGDGSFSSLWLYWVAPFAGGALAATVFKMQEREGA